MEAPRIVSIIGTLGSVIPSPEEERAQFQQEFVDRHGEPEAIIRTPKEPHGFDRLLRMPGGKYWGTLDEATDAPFVEVDPIVGKELEQNAARVSIRRLEIVHVMAKRHACLASGTDFFLELPTPVAFAKSPSLSYFGNVAYFKNRGGKISYGEKSNEAKYIRYQDTSSCVPISILNGALFQGQAVDKKLVKKFHEKLATLPGVSYSSESAVNIPALLRQNIPGLQSTRLEGGVQEMKDLLDAKKPVLVAADYFSKHAMAVIDVHVEKGTFTAVDSATGVVFEETIENLSVATELIPRDTASLGNIRSNHNYGASKVFGRQRIAAAISALCYAPPVYSKPVFYSIELIDMDAFMEWVEE